MAIIVEDGSIVSNANSYVTEAELTQYASDRGITITGDTEQLLIKSMDYIESLSYIGVKFTIDQPLQWPRADVVIDGYYFNSDAIPKELKKGQMETALSVDAGVDPLAPVTRGKKSVSVGAVSVTYDDVSESGSTTLVRSISSSLQKLLKGGSGTSGSSFIVDRG